MALDHYVSQVHLRRFYSPVLGNRGYAMRKSDLKRFTPRSEDVCRSDEGSTNEYLTEPRVIEEFLKTVEGKYNTAVASFEAGAPTNGDVYVLAGFVSYLLTCSPAAMRINSGPLEGSLGVAAKLLNTQGVFPPPPPELGGKDLAELLASGKIKFDVDPKYPQAIGIANILDRVVRFGDAEWTLLVNEHEDCPFFTSDFPVGIQAFTDTSVFDRVAPLTPTLAVSIRPRDKLQTASFDFNHFSLKRRKLKRPEAAAINRLLVRCAEDTVLFSDDQPWIAGFIEKNRHFRIETKEFDHPAAGGPGRRFRQEISAFRRV